MKIPCIIHDSRIEINEYWKGKIQWAVKDNGAPIRAEIHTLLPESRKQRAYLMGGLLKLLVYLDGNDYRDSDVCEYYFEHYKKEFYPEVLTIKGKVEVFGKSTKGSAGLNRFIERLQEFLNENYGISYDNLAMSPDEYKKFRDEIYMFGKYTDFIEYCVAMNYIMKH